MLKTCFVEHKYFQLIARRRVYFEYPHERLNCNWFPEVSSSVSSSVPDEGRWEQMNQIKAPRASHRRDESGTVLTLSEYCAINTSRRVRPRLFTGSHNIPEMPETTGRDERKSQILQRFNPKGNINVSMQCRVMWWAYVEGTRLTDGQDSLRKTRYEPTSHRA